MLKRLTAASALLVLAAPASAHEGHDHAVNFVQGFAHPFTGVDHIAAMVLVGLWAALIGGTARWLLPAAFIAAMMAGGMCALLLPGARYVEGAIALSVLALGAAVLAAWRTRAALAAGLVAMAALAHGYAHIAEAQGGSALPLAAYAAGFVLATALLHAAGLLLGSWAAVRAALMPRLAGGAAIGLGLALLVR